MNIKQSYTDVKTVDIMNGGVNAIMQTYSNGMKEKITQQMKNKNGLKKTKSIDSARGSARGSANKSLNETLQSDGSLKVPSVKDISNIKHSSIVMEEDRETKILELLNESETYYENNMNAAANSMSTLTLHAFEITHHLEQQKKDQATQEKVMRNIEAHANFIG